MSQSLLLTSRRFLLLFLLPALASLPPLAAAAESGPGWKAGAARVDVTPDYPVRLSGYGSRTTESQGVALRIWAKALALQWGEGPPAVLITIDNTGIPARVRDAVREKLTAAGHQIDDARFAIHSSHSHCAPHVRGYLPFIFGEDLPPEQNERIDRYTAEVTAKMAQAAQQALEHMQPAKLAHGLGEVGFAGNRRFRSPAGFINSPNPAGPVDHTLSVLRVTGGDGAILAVLTSYACHCTTLSFDQIHGDWAGEAQVEIEKQIPGAVALTAIGCGGDQNPYPRREVELARQHGAALAAEAVRVARGDMRAIAGPLECRAKKLTLPLDTPPTKQELEERIKSPVNPPKHYAYASRHFLGLLERGEKLPSAVPYHAQVWAFGKDLLVVNLAGEVVIDYALRLKKENDPARTWVNAYTNDVPCYIPSQRVWEEGGYEAAGAMTYYGWPTRLATGAEERIFAVINELVPAGFGVEGK